ncbi:MAG: FAD-dependent 5-carboxymethylaminomethyl-2-thiouridine(34) oxidoreductase MnmC [Betaproteobacteria bacterium]|nr:FAD-dependent 5-carboxymethylaminomethyl-2-thiouridine(34) oxidoreductase MnmC [Betaproteobacteria bacterium]
MATIKHPDIQFINNTLFSTEFNDVYHSSFGGIEQAKAVFIEGNHLNERFSQLQRKQFCLFETGFGIGINFLVTLATWAETQDQHNAWLNYVAVEKYPLSRELLSSLLHSYPFNPAFITPLIEQWPLLTPGYHEIRFPEQRVCLTLIISDIKDAVKSLTMTIDAIYLDGFSPQKNPDMWHGDIFAALAQHCHGETTLASWCVAGTVRQNLIDAGFNVSRHKGFAQKKHRLEGQFNRIPQDKQTLRQSRYFPHVARYLKGNLNKQIAVIGAGIAGSLTAYHLCQRGIAVCLFDRHDAIATQASGNPAGILRPVISKDDNVLSRISRRGFYLTKQLIEELESNGNERIAHYPGVIHFAKNQEEELGQRESIETLGFSRDYACFLEAAEIQERFQLRSELGGIYFPQAGFINPKKLCERAVQLSAPSLSILLNTEITRLHYENRWQLFNQANECLGEFDAVILTLGASHLAQTMSLNLKTNRGQLSLFTHPQLPQTQPVLCKEGYLITLPQQQLLAGATYEHDLDLNPWPSSHLENQQRIHAILGQDPQTFTAINDRVALRSVSKDRLPVVGELNEHLYCVLANASRGIVWSTLNARIIRSLITAEPMPIEQQLVTQLSPARLC